MQKIILLATLVLGGIFARAQKVDSIYFHLYTDSLKKGQHNYINIDGKLSDGNWMPLTDKELIFTTTEVSFSGNELIIPPDFRPAKVTVRVALRSNPQVWKEKTIWIKQLPDPPLPGREDIKRRRN